MARLGAAARGGGGFLKKMLGDLIRPAGRRAARGADNVAGEAAGRQTRTIRNYIGGPRPGARSGPGTEAMRAAPGQHNVINGQTVDGDVYGNTLMNGGTINGNVYGSVVMRDGAVINGNVDGHVVQLGGTLHGNVNGNVVQAGRVDGGIWFGDDRIL